MKMHLAVLAVSMLSCLGSIRAQPSSWSTFVLPVGSRTDVAMAGTDLNGDGRADLLVGGNGRYATGCLDAAHRALPSPLRVLLSNGDGTFRDGTAAVVARRTDSFFTPATPFELVADFNGDGIPDFAVFDYGVECVLQPGVLGAHSYIGFPPILLLSGPGGRWHASSVLADAVAKANAKVGISGKELRVLSAAAGDVDGNGTIDIWVETCGAANVCSHFLINNGDGTFTADTDRVPFEALHGAPPRFWRHDATALVDVDRDGCPDLVMGQLRDGDVTHIDGASFIFLNDCEGRFSAARRITLPQPNFAAGYTAVSAMLATDVDGDGLPDLVFMHRRNGPNPQEPTAHLYGRYTQVLMNRGGGRFVDETAERWGDQSFEMREKSVTAPSETLDNQAWRAFLVDADGDGVLDVVMGSKYYLRAESPLVYLNNGRGRFSSLDTRPMTGSDNYFGEGALPLDLNGDGLVDFVHLDQRPGADGVYGTGDETSNLISSIGHGIAGRNPEQPRMPSAQISGTDVKLAWLVPSSGPRPERYQIEIGATADRFDVVTVRSPDSKTVMSFEKVPPGKYFVRVRSVLGASLSAPSTTLLVHVNGPCTQAPSAPVLNHFVEGTTVNFEWFGSGAATGFVLEAGKTPGASDYVLPTDTARVLTVASVPEGIYFARMRGRNACGIGSPSNELTVTVGKAPLGLRAR